MKKDYKILSIIDDEQNIIDTLGMRSYEDFLDNHSNYQIYSILRISDNKTFTLNDNIQLSEDNACGKIESITYDNAKAWIVFNDMTECLDDIVSAPSYKIVVSTPNYIELFDVNDAPDEVIHLVRNNRSNKVGMSYWFMFKEDAYELEPYQNGINLLSEEDIKSMFDIDIPNLPKLIDLLLPFHTHAELVDGNEIVYREKDILNLLKKIL